MRVEWIVAVVTFLMFVVWAFSHYSLINVGEAVSRGEAAMRAGGKVAGYMKTESVQIPANFTSASDTDNATLWAYMNWTGNRTNSTRVVTERYSNASLPCLVSGDRLYWKANVSAGDNFFFIEQAELETDLNCGQSLALEDNQTTLWAEESLATFSSARNSLLCGQMNGSYDSVKGAIGVAFDFNVLLESPGSVFTCGPGIPRGRDVFVYTASGRLWEGGEVNVSVRLW